MSELGRILIIGGIVLLVAGAAVLLFNRFPGFPLGKLPGDFSWRSGETRIYVPVASMIVVSLILTILVNVILRLFR